MGEQHRNLVYAFDVLSMLRCFFSAACKGHLVILQLTCCMSCHVCIMHPQITPTLFFQFLGKEVSITLHQMYHLVLLNMRSSALVLYNAISCSCSIALLLISVYVYAGEHDAQVEGSGTPGESLLGHSSQDSVGMDMWSFCTVSTTTIPY
jgi:hypothetical protein